MQALDVAAAGAAAERGHHPGERRAVLREERRHELLQRSFDIIVGSLLLLLTLPIIVIAAIGSAIVLRAWPFFVQDRVGRGGRTFRFVKIRTLPRSTNSYADKYQLVDVAVPRFTRMLRDLHVDELPQLALVVSGRMSLVGPRPEMPALAAELAPDFAASRTVVRPGCTGLWQVSSHSRRLIGEAPEFDEFYVTNRGLRLDLWVMWRTLCMVGRGGRSTLTLANVPAWVGAAAESDSVIDLRDESEPVVLDLSLSGAGRSRPARTSAMAGAE